MSMMLLLDRKSTGGLAEHTGGLPKVTGGLPERTGGLLGLRNIEHSMCNLF